MPAIEGLAAVVMAFRVKNLIHRFSVLPVIVAGFTLIGISLMAISFVPSVVVILLLLILFVAGFGLAQTTIDVLIVLISPRILVQTNFFSTDSTG